MTFLAILAAAIVITLVCRTPIKRYPWVFYLIAALLSVLYFTNRMYGVPELDGVPESLMMATIQKGSLGVAFFVIVMYVGVFDRSSKVRTFLSPIRGELSIIAWLLVMGHIAVYAMSYFPRLFGGAAFKGNVMFSLVCGVVLFVLVMVLGVTSINVVRRAMGGKAWKALQRWAYVFYALVYGHMVAILLPSALKGATTAQVSIAVYTVIFGAYLVLKIRHELREKKRRAGAGAVEATGTSGAETANADEAR